MLVQTRISSRRNGQRRARAFDDRRALYHVAGFKAVHFENISIILFPVPAYFSRFLECGPGRRNASQQPGRKNRLFHVYTARHHNCCEQIPQFRGFCRERVHFAVKLLERRGACVNILWRGEGFHGRAKFQVVQLAQVLHSQVWPEGNVFFRET